MSDFADKTYYEILGVSQEASTEEIKEAYRNIARAYHPDSNFYDEIVPVKEDSPDQDKFKKITEAYNTLINEERRKEYDKLFPAGLRDWDDIERNVRKDENKAVFNSREDLVGTIYRPRGNTGAFRRSTFGVVEPTAVPTESAIETALRGRSIQPIEIEPERNILPLFVFLLIGGFLAGGALAYWLVTHS